MEAKISTTQARAKPLSLYLLIFLLLFLALGALVGGYSLIRDPSGESLQIPLALLEATIFHNYLIPGLLLFTLLGLYPLGCLIALRFFPKAAALTSFMQRYLPQYHWIQRHSFAIGLILLIWIIVQIVMLGIHHIMQLVMDVIFLSVALAIIALSFNPAIRNYYLEPDNP